MLLECENMGRTLIALLPHIPPALLGAEVLSILSGISLMLTTLGSPQSLDIGKLEIELAESRRRYLREIVTNRDNRARIAELRGNDAQRVIDFMDNVNPPFDTGKK